MQRRAGLIALLLLCSASAGAQTAYVTDLLQLGIHRAPDTSDQPFRNLASGTQLEILEQVPRFARVRTPDGEEGWVRSAFLVTEQPARHRVAELEAAVAELNARLDSVAAASVAVDGPPGGALVGGLAGIPGDTAPLAGAIQDVLAELESENQLYEAQLEAYRGSVPWSWVWPAFVLALLAGFAAGLWCLDAFIRRRHGGFRVW